MTTDHRTIEVGSNVTSIAAQRARRRARLEHLLDLRERLAVIAAERRSHNLDDAWEHELELYRVEQVIADGWPRVYVERFPVWMEHEHAVEHPTGVLTDRCGICAGIAGAGGLNLHPPLAG